MEHTSEHHTTATTEASAVTPAVAEKEEPRQKSALVFNGKELNILSLLSITSAVASVAGWTIFAILAVVFGHVSLAQFKKDPTQSGRGFALAGLITGYVIIGLHLITIIVILAFIGAGVFTGLPYMHY